MRSLDTSFVFRLMIAVTRVLDVCASAATAACVNPSLLHVKVRLLALSESRDNGLAACKKELSESTGVVAPATRPVVPRTTLVDGAAGFAANRPNPG